MSRPIAISSLMRRQTTTLASWGHTQEEIAGLLGLNEKTLQRRLGAEFKAGELVAGEAIEYNLKRIASDRTGAHPGPTVAAAIFYCKARRGWHEVQRIIHGFDPATVNQFVGKVVAAIKRLVPEHCPACKTNLNIRPALAGELLAMSAKMEQQLPPVELIPTPAKEGG